MANNRPKPAEIVTKLPQFEGQFQQSNFPESWSDEKTRTEADVIKTCIRMTIEQDLVDDHYAQRVFSDLLKVVIAAAEAMFDHPGKQYTNFEDLEDQVAARWTSSVPVRFER